MNQADHRFAQSLLSPSDFWPFVGHELRNPLTTILAQSEAMTAGIFGPLRPEQARAMQSIQECVRGMLPMIDDAVELASGKPGPSPGEATSSPVSHAIDSAIKALGPSAKQRSITLVTAASKWNVSVQADVVVLQRIIIELISLMLALAPMRSSVVVSTECDEGDVSIRVRSGVDVSGDEVESTAASSPLVTAIWKLRPLGCAILSKLVESHKVMWHVLRRDETITGFVLRFKVAPVTDAMPAGSSMPLNQEGASTGRPITILLADDQPDLAAITCHYMESLGHSVIIARDGEEAVELACRLQPDLILMDVQMPVMNGLTATQLIRESSWKLSTIPIICLTGMTTNADKQRCIAAGATTCLAKPFGIKEINQLLAEFV